MKYIKIIQGKIKIIVSDRKKLGVSIGITFSIIVGIFIGIYLTKPKVDEILKNIYSIDKPIVVKSKDKYAYLTEVGDELLEEEFTYASPFYGDYAAISREDISEKDIKYELIDKTGITHLTSSDEPKYLKDYGIWQISNSLYDQNLNVLFEGDYKLSYLDDGFFVFLDNAKVSSGIIDYNGKKTYEHSSNYINVSISHSEVLSDRYGVVSNYEGFEAIVNLKNGKVIFVLEDTNTKYIRESEDNIFKIIDRSNNYKTERWFYIEADRIAFDTKEAIYDISFFDIKNRVLKIDYGPGYANYGHKTRETYYLINEKKFDENFKADIQNANEIKIEQLYKISKNKIGEKFELYKNGSKVVENVYDDIALLDFDLFRYLKKAYKIEPVLFTSGNVTYLYDLKNEKVLKEFETAHVEEKDDSTFLLGTIYKSDGFTKEKYDIYNIATNSHIEIVASNQVKFYSNYLTVTEGNKTIYYNSEFKKIYEIKD